MLVEGRKVAAIGQGLVILLGVGHDDTEAIAMAQAKRVTELRIFEDEAGKTNRSILDVAGSAVVVSQFTLYADTSRGRRPGFTNAAASLPGSCSWGRKTSWPAPRSAAVNMAFQSRSAALNSGPAK